MRSAYAARVIPSESESAGPSQLRCGGPPTAACVPSDACPSRPRRLRCLRTCHERRGAAGEACRPVEVGPAHARRPPAAATPASMRDHPALRRMPSQACQPAESDSQRPRQPSAGPPAARRRARAGRTESFQVPVVGVTAWTRPSSLRSHGRRRSESPQEAWARGWLRTHSRPAGRMPVGSLSRHARRRGRTRACAAAAELPLPRRAEPAARRLGAGDGAARSGASRRAEPRPCAGRPARVRVTSRARVG